MFPDRMGIKETGSVHGVELHVVPLPRFLQAWGLLGFYYYLGANIQPGVLEKGGRVVVTEMKRKPGPGNPQEHGENKEAAVRKRERIREVRETRATKRGEDIKNWKDDKSSAVLTD